MSTPKKRPMDGVNDNHSPLMRALQRLREHILDAAFYAESGDCHDPRCQRLIAAGAATKALQELDNLLLKLVQPPPQAGGDV